MKHNKSFTFLKILFLCAFQSAVIIGCQNIQAAFVPGNVQQSEPIQATGIPDSVLADPILSNTQPPDLRSAMTPTDTASPIPTATRTEIPTITPTPTQLPTPTPRAAPFFDQFVTAIMNGDPARVVGVYVENVLALKVVQQPNNNPSFVSGVKGVATYFSMVHAQTGNTGLLAHNYLAGVYYYDLMPGEVVVLIYGDGRTEEFVVADSLQFQALNPTSPTSSFVNVTTGERLTSTALFRRVYGGSYKTTFQTCIAQGNEPSWGRLFVIAPQD